MHVVLGVALTILAFVLAQYAHGQLPFFGLLNPAALVLLLIGAVAVSMISHPFREWATMWNVLKRAFSHHRERSLREASEEMGRIARAVRESRWDEVEVAVREAKSEQVKNIAPHLMSRPEPDALREAVGNSAFTWMAEVKNSDDFLQGLARLSPAFGMIGTIMGLVDLFRSMRDSASLGPGMAMALLATLYGLVLCYCVYMPLSQRVRTYLAAGTGELKLVERAMALTLEGRPVNEVRNAVLESTNGAAHASMVSNSEGRRQ